MNVFKTVTSSALRPLLSVFEVTSDGIQVFDAAGQLIYANAAAAQALGYASQQEYLSSQCTCHSWLAHHLHTSTGVPLDPQDFPCVQALQGRTVPAQILRYIDLQGRQHDCTIQAFPVRDDVRAMTYGVVVSRDLSDLKSAQQRLQQSTQQFHQITDAVPSWVACLDDQERHHYANPAYLKAFGRSLDTLLGEPLQAVLGPVVYQQVQKALQLARSGDTAELCLPLTNYPQPTQYKHIIVIPQLWAATVEGFYLVINDITAHQHTTHLLHNQTDFFQHALESAAVGIWEWNLITDELMWSQQQEQLFGLQPGSFDGKPETFLALVDPHDHSRLLATLEPLWKAKQSQTCSVEFRVLLPNGHVRWLSQRGQVIVNDAGTPIRLAGVTFDMTIQKAAEEKLRQQVKREHLIAKISQDISRSKNLREVLPQVAQEVRTFLAVDRLVIIDLQDKMAGEITYEDHSPEVESMLGWKLRHTWVVKEKFLEKYRQGYPIAVTNIRDQTLSDAECAFLQYFQIMADLTIPLIEEDELWGLLSAHHSRARHWLPEDRRLLETLGTQVSTAIQRDKLHRHLTQANQQLKRFAYLDGLTQVANRRRFEQFINHEWRRLLREKAPLSVIMADIDHFKAYNDIYGHQAGDECLRRVAGTIRSAVQRPADMVARYGGEEFVVVLPNTDLQGAETVAEKVRTLVRSQKIPHKGATPDPIVTLSLGVASLIPYPLKSPEDVIQAADLALYRAKHEGRDRVMLAKSD